MTTIQDIFLYRVVKKELGATFKCTENSRDTKNNMVYICNQSLRAVNINESLPLLEQTPEETKPIM